MASISLCMIVKNEESVLKRCLDSIKDLMDEIIIVDTGSTDNTISIAKEYTDRIYEYTWDYNFSNARNFCISKATCDYIYTADADEVIDEDNRKAFRLLKENILPEIEIVQMYYSGQYENNTVYNYDEELRPKLFKRERSFTFIDPIHETLRLDPVVYDSDVRIFHKPHDIHTQRDIDIFVRNFGEDSSSQIPARLISMLGKELFISGTDSMFVKAAPVFKKIEDKELDKDDFQIVLACLAKAARIQGNITEFMKYSLRAVASEGSSEICYELGLFFEEKGDRNEAEIWYSNSAYETAPVCLLKTPELAISKLS